MMNWIEIITLCSCLVTILGSPVVFALYLGHKMDALSEKLNRLSGEVGIMKKQRRK